MIENRVTVYGLNSESEAKRAFDLVWRDGQCYFDSKDRKGCHIYTSIEAFKAQYERLLELHRIV